MIYIVLEGPGGPPSLRCHFGASLTTVEDMLSTLSSAGVLPSPLDPANHIVVVIGQHIVPRRELLAHAMHGQPGTLQCSVQVLNDPINANPRPFTLAPMAVPQAEAE